jgi:hypothetical protein
MRSLALGLFVMLSGCAAPSGPPEQMPEHHTLMIVAGTQASLSAFERAARHCGVHGISRVAVGHGGTWVRIRGPISTNEVLATYRCAENWVTAHSADLRLLGVDEAEQLFD